MREKRLELIKQEIRSVLISSKDGLSLAEFLRAYRNLLGVRLPTREFGYTSDIDFLYSISDVVQVQVDKNGTFQLSGIADEKTAHIQKLVKKQKSVKVKTNGISKYRTNVKTSYENPRHSAVSTRCRPFVPARLRAEIIQVTKQYPDGIGYCALVLAYRHIFNKTLNLEWLSTNQNERFSKLVNAVPELELKVINGQEKLHFVDQYSNDINISNGTNASRSSYRLEHFKEIEKAAATKSNLKLQPLNRLLDTSGISERVKDNIEKVLKQFPTGVLALHFPILYEKITRETFDLHELGYISLLDLVDALPDIFFRTASSENAKDWLLLHVEFSKNKPFSDTNSKPVSANGATTQKHSNSYCSTENSTPDLASSALQYLQQELPDDGTSQFFPVYVSALINPSLFWFQLQTEDAVENLKKLEKEMEYFYNSQKRGQYRMKDADIAIGSSCAFCTSDNNWFRGVISSLPSVENASVLFVDYGSWEKIPRSNLYSLKYSFISFPVHAFKAELAALMPSSQKWDIKASKRFIELCNKTSVMARVNSVHDQTISIFLCDTTGEEDIHINHVLVREGYAKYCIKNGTNCSYLPANPNQNSENSSSSTSPQSNTEQLGIKATPNSNNVANGGSSFHLRNGIQNGFKPKRLFPNEFEEQPKRKSVRKVLLGDGYKVHIIIVENEAYISSGDLCNLLWKGKGADSLACKLDFKEVTIPTRSILKQDFGDLFAQCEKYSIEGFNENEANYSVILYLLKYSLKVLNVFGHPSTKVRDTIINEIEKFDPLANVWLESENNCEDSETYVDESDIELDRLCSYDLITRREGLKYKKLKLLRNYKEEKDGRILNEVKKIELMQQSIAGRIEQIKEICSTYCMYTSL